MVGHGLAEGGLNQAPVHLGPREMRDEQLFPFEAAVRGCGHGQHHARLLRRRRRAVPCLQELLTTILREQWGFDGIVASDYTAIQMLATQHKLTRDLGDGGGAGPAGRRRQRAAERPSPMRQPLLEALADGRVDEALLDPPSRGSCG